MRRALMTAPKMRTSRMSNLRLPTRATRISKTPRSRHQRPPNSCYRNYSASSNNNSNNKIRNPASLHNPASLRKEFYPINRPQLRLRILISPIRTAGFRISDSLIYVPEQQVPLAALGKAYNCDLGWGITGKKSLKL
jgi:hypothetical protein